MASVDVSPFVQGVGPKPIRVYVSRYFSSAIPLTSSEGYSWTKRDPHDTLEKSRQANIPGQSFPHILKSLYTLYIWHSDRTFFFDANNCEVHDYLWRQASIPEQAQWAWSKGDVRGPEIFRKSKKQNHAYICKAGLGLMPQLMFWFLQSIHFCFEHQ